MTVEPTCPGCKHRSDFSLMEWPIKYLGSTKEIEGTFVYCSYCGTAINWIPKHIEQL